MKYLRNFESVIAHSIVLMVFAVSGVMSACASLDEDEQFEREYTRVELTDKYRLCQRYTRGWISQPPFATRTRRNPTPLEMRREMAANQCAITLRRLEQEDY